MEDDSEAAIASDIAAVARIGAVPTILDMVCRATDMGFAAVARVSERTWTACAVRDRIGFGLQPGGQLELSTTLCREVRAEGEPIVIDHVAQDERYCGHPTPQRYGFQSYISMPIRLPDGEYFGNLCAIDPRPMRLSEPRIVDMFRLFAELIGQQLDGERRHLETGVALADARATAELREQFIAVLGHDLRNPLASMLAIGEVLKRDASATVAGLAARILVSAGRMSALIDDALDFARGRLGAGMALNRRDEDHLAQRLTDVVPELQIAHPGQRIDSSIGALPRIRCDGRRLQQLLSNLVKNALVHGSPTEPVTVRAGVEDRHLFVEVLNRGTPIPADQLRRVFQPYWRSNAGPAGGLGLGLYICAEIARAHGGTIRVTSSADDGTRFTARLPLDAPPA